MRTPTSALLLLATLAMLASPVVRADAGSPLGTWQTISDTTGKPAGIVEITEQGGVLSGRIVKVLEAGASTVCDQCTDARKGQPIVGMVFLSGLRKHGDVYDGGEILDPDNGKIYRAEIRLRDGGAKLEVRGYIGIPLFGRSQIWLREK